MKKQKVEQKMTMEQFEENIKKYFDEDKWILDWALSIYYVSCYLRAKNNGPTGICHNVSYLTSEKKWEVNGYKSDTLEQALIAANFDIIIDLLNENNDCHNKSHELFIKLNTSRTKFLINRIFYNKKKETTVVEFYNKDKVVVHKAKDVKSDIYTAVAFAIIKRMFENNSRFQKFVDEMVSDKWNGENNDVRELK